MFFKISLRKGSFWGPKRVPSRQNSILNTFYLWSKVQKRKEKIENDVLKKRVIFNKFLEICLLLFLS